MDAHNQIIMLKFLKDNFPIQRLKNVDRFQRGILIPKALTGVPDSKYFFRPKGNKRMLLSSIYNILYSVFGVSNKEIVEAIKTHFNIWEIDI